MFRSFPLCYEAHGDPVNPSILLIAGIGGQLVNWPSTFIQSLVDHGFYVVAYDNRDAGLSKHYDEYGNPNLNDLLQGKLPDSYYTLNDMAADAVLLLDELKIQKAHIVGISMGGMIAQLVAINHPSRVESLTCIATSSSEKGLPDSTKEVQQFFFSPKRDKESTKANYIIEKSALYKIYNHPDYFDENEVNSLHDRIYDRNHDASGFMRQLIAMAVANPRTQQLNALDIPALIIHGDYDPVFPTQHGRQLANAIRGSKLIELEKFGHGLPGYFCEVIAKHMNEFYEHIEKPRNEKCFTKK
jgi:pimeloyl-ACP methyl ester carboxylesterase